MFTLKQAKFTCRCDCIVQHYYVQYANNMQKVFLYKTPNLTAK